MARLLIASILSIASVLALATSVYGVTPHVEYKVTYNAKNAPGGRLWQTQLGEAYSKDRMAAATKTVLERLGITDIAHQTWNIGHVTLLVDDLPDNNGAAITTHFGNSICQIHLNANFLQWYGDASTRSGDVVEGIADYVKLKAGYACPDWVANGGGGPWYNQYSGATPRFFNYIVDHVNSKFIVKMDQMMMETYKEDFFRQITGKTVDQLWRQYKHYYN